MLIACAAQAPPRPPRVERPERITDLAVAQVGRTIEISFTLPTLAEDGERLTKPLEVELLREIIPPGQKLQETEKLSPWVTLPATDLTRQANGEKIVYAARLSEQEFEQGEGSTFRIALRSIARGFRHRPIESDLSNVVDTTLLNVSRPVEEPKLTVTEKTLALRWAPATRNLGNRPPLRPSGYRVYRSTAGNAGPFELVGETSSPSYEDHNFAFGRTYFFKVRAVFRRDSVVAESQDSPVVEIIPRDTFPPAAPEGLTAAYAEGTVDLIWNANTEPDLAGYNIYRREKNTSPQKLNKELLRTPLFRDSSVEAGHEYFYKVTAVDLSHNESLPSGEVTIEAR